VSDLDPNDLEIRARLGLQGGGLRAHPAGEALVAFEEDPASLSDGARAWIAKHVESCASCREALAAVPALGPAMEARPAAAARFVRPWLMAAGWLLAAILCVKQLATEPRKLKPVLESQIVTLSQARGETQRQPDAPMLRAVDLVRFECVLSEEVRVGQKLHVRVEDAAGRTAFESDAEVAELNQFGWPVFLVDKSALPKGRMTVHVRAPSGSEIAVPVVN
jgi:hypothetical protein